MANFVSPNYALEQSICNYLTSCQTNTNSMLYSQSYTCYTGVSNTVKVSAPAIIVDCSDMTETVLYSRNYKFNTVVQVMEMAADTPINNLGILGEAVFNEFVAGPISAANFANPSTYNINVWACMQANIRPSFNEDTLTNTITVEIVGALVNG